MKPDPSESRPASSPVPGGETTIGGMRVHAGTYGSTTARVIEWARQGDPRYVCIANVHMVMEARDSADYRGVVNRADWVTSDGVPLVWVLRARGFSDAQRVYGPTLMLSVCRAAAAHGVPIGLFGGTADLLEKLTDVLVARDPALKIVARIAPPFGTPTAAETESYAKTLRESGAGIVFVGLGCPKQERWMAEAHAKIPAVLLGVGAAFNFHTGKVRQSPAWMQRLGLEWLFRLAMEPRRLWRRYLWHNPRFILLVLGEQCARIFKTSRK